MLIRELVWILANWKAEIKLNGVGSEPHSFMYVCKNDVCVYVTVMEILIKKIIICLKLWFLYCHYAINYLEFVNP